MGFLNKLYGKENTEKTIHIDKTCDQHQQKWEFYFSYIDDKPGYIFVDLGLYGIAPIVEKPNIVWVSVKMKNPTEESLSSNEESKLLWTIENELVENMVAKHGSVYTGRITSAGYRHFYFHLGDHTLYDKTISDAMVAFPMYEFDFSIKEDREWYGYLNLLYPNPAQFQSIQNRRVIDELEEAGDSLIKQREVFHWIYFRSDVDREKYLDKIQKDGFSFVDKYFDKSWGEFAYCLQVKRVDRVDHNSVDQYVIYLWELANKLNAEYDGWETSVEKD